MSVSLNLQENTIGCVAFFSLKNSNYFITRISSITEQTILSTPCYGLLPLHKFKLFSKCTTISSFCKKYFLLAVAALFLYANVTLFQFRTLRTLFTSFVHASKSQFWSALPGWSSYMEKHHPSETRFLICKSQISVVKDIQPSRFFTCVYSIF